MVFDRLELSSEGNKSAEREAKTATNPVSVDRRSGARAVYVHGFVGLPSTEPHQLLASLTLDGINACLYQSTIDDHVVLDVLTETPGPIEHDDDDRPLLRITVNDAG